MRARRDSKRIALVIGSARPGGAEGQLIRLACELKARDYDVYVLFTAAGGSLTTMLDSGGVPWVVMRPERWPSSTTVRTVLGVLRLAWTLARLRPDVVFAWLAGAIWFTLPIAMVLTRAKRFAAFRGEVFERDLRWFAPLFRSAVRRAHCVTVNAPALRGEAIRWGAVPDRVVFVPNGVDLPEITADVTTQPPTAVVVANYRWYKGHDVLVEALVDVDADLQVRLCGEGDIKTEIQERVMKLGLAERVTFVDDPADVPTELRNAQFAIHPSRTEGLSNAILEELAYGLPIVATDVGGTALLVEPDLNGYLVPAADSAALAARVAQLASDPALRKSMALEARRRAETFSWSHCVDSYERIFDQARGAGVGS